MQLLYKIYVIMWGGSYQQFPTENTKFANENLLFILALLYLFLIQYLPHIGTYLGKYLNISKILYKYDTALAPAFSPQP